MKHKEVTGGDQGLNTAGITATSKITCGGVPKRKNGAKTGWLRVFCSWQRMLRHDFPFCLGCHNTIPDQLAQPGQIHFPKALETVSPRLGSHRGKSWWGRSSWLADECLLAESSRGGGQSSGVSSSSYRALIPSWQHLAQGLHRPKAHVQILLHEELGFQYRSLGRAQLSPQNSDSRHATVTKKDEYKECPGRHKEWKLPKSKTKRHS